METIVSNTSIKVQSIEQYVSSLEIAMGYSTVEVQVVEATCNINGDLQPLGPG